MGITNRVFGKQKNTGDRIKQTFWWTCFIPQAVAGWLVFVRYFDLQMNGGPVKFMTAMERFWWETGAIALVVILLFQIVYVWTLRGVYHRGGVTQREVYEDERGEDDLFEVDEWVDQHKEDGIESRKLTQLMNEKQLLLRIHNHPPETVEQCKIVMKQLRSMKLDLQKDPWKKVYNNILNKRRTLERKENREKKESLGSPSPIPLID